MGKKKKRVKLFMVTAINYNTHKILNNMTNIHKMFLPKIIKILT